MTSTGGQERRARGAGLGAAAVTLGLGAWLSIAAFHPFTPAMPQLGLDASWVAVMGEGAERGLRWGPDLAFTYGPAASLVTGYFNGSYLTATLPILIAACLLFAACTALAVPPGRRLGAAVAVGLIAALSTGYPDSLFLVMPLAPALLRLSPARAGIGTALAAGAAAFVVGMVGMAKTSFPLAALPLFMLADAAGLLRRRAPVLALPCLLGFLLADALYGQSLADLPAFLRGQWEAVSGYSEAMALDGSRVELLAYLLASAAAVLLALGTGRAERGGSATRFAMPFGLAWVLLILLKAGFVHQDTHTLIAWFGLSLAVALVAAARFSPPIAKPVVGTAVVGAALLGLGLVGPTAPAVGRGAAAAAAAQAIFASNPTDQLAAALGLARDPSGSARAWGAERDRRWRGLAASSPLPRLAGGVDVLPSRQSLVIASGLDYRPRPSFQEYSTYTPALIAANRAFLAGPRAPDWILFGPESPFGVMVLDRLYPNLAEGGLWLDLLGLYRPERRIGDLVALHRRATPAPLALGAPRRSEVAFDEPVEVAPPPPGARAVFATVEVRPTALGRLLGFLFRPPPLTIDVRFADGHERAYQFVSGMGSSGFILSPLIDNSSEFEGLAEGAPPPPDRVVSSFRLLAPPRMRALLSPRIGVTLQDVSGGEAVARPAASSAWASLAAADGIAPDAPDVGVLPPSFLTVPVPGLSRLDLGFGLALAEDAPPGAERLCFAIHPADGTGRALWRRCLDRAAAADRAPQSVSIPLPPGTAELALETSCEAGCEEGMGGYWAPP